MSFSPVIRNEKLNIALNKWEAILQENTRVIEALKNEMKKRVN